ncbi:protease complex subunit PrcB family protein [Candidatus Woesearchaeota archaeon]|nr:protease complex subunit PrcB family protein [Candidatus Woesearchaeota archaeon]
MEKTISLEEISKGAHSAHNERTHYKISDNVTWNKVWTKTFANCSSIPAVPSVDFSTEMVLAVYMGAKSSGGYNITIEKIVETEERLEILVKEVNRKPGMMTTMAITKPYHIVKTAKSNKELLFKYT